MNRELSLTITKKPQLYGPFLWMGFNDLKASATSRRQFTFYHQVSRYSWYSFYRSLKDERLSRPWSHPVVLSTRPLDWKSSTLTTRPLLKHYELCNYAWLLDEKKVVGSHLLLVVSCDFLTHCFENIC